MFYETHSLFDIGELDKIVLNPPLDISEIYLMRKKVREGNFEIYNI